jgi:proteic killer suppression protein
MTDLKMMNDEREKLAGHCQEGFRIDDQWRICFRWTKAGPEEVTITGYQ